MLLGLSFLEDHYMVIDTVNRNLVYSPPNGEESIIELHCDIIAKRECTVRTITKECIPPRFQTQILVKIADTKMLEEEEAYFEPNYQYLNHANGLIVADTYNKVTDAKIVIEVMNAYDSLVELDMNTFVGTFFSRIY